GSGSPTGERALTGQANASHTLATPAVTKLAPIPAQQTIGGEADYDLLVTLPEGAVTNLRIRDALPVGLGYVSHGIITTAAASGGILAADYNGTLTTTPTVVVSGGTLEFQFGDVQTNGSGPGNGTSANQFVVRVRTRVLNEVGNQNGTLLVNTANLGYVNPQTGDTTVLDGLRTLTVIEPELQLTKLADDDTPGLGQTVTYTLVVEHLPSSTADALDLVVVDVLPLGLTYLGGSAAGPAGWSAAYNGLTRELTFQASVLTLASGSAALIYQVEVDSPPPPNIGDVLTNNAVLTWTSLPGPDAGERTGGGGVNDYTATATESLTVTGIDLVLTKDDVVASVSPGEDLAYTLTYQNVGNADATGVVITDVVPDYTTFNPGASTPGWTCLPNNNAGSTCTLALAGSVLGGAPAVPVTFAVTVDASVPVMVTLLQNAASITDDGTHGIEPTPADNTDSETTPLVAAPDLTITKDDGLDIVSPGSLLVYAINYANVGDQDATGVVVTETVPLATTFVAASSLPTVWSCPDGSTGGTVCTMTIGNLAAGASGALTFAVRIADPVPALTTQVVDTITIADDGTNGPEPPTGNNTDTDTDNLVTLPNADLTKTLDTTNQAHTLDPAVAIGEILTYQLELTIPQGTMTSAALTDVVDLGLAFVRCVSLTPSPGLTTIPAGAFAAACASPTVAEEPAGSGAAEDQGRRVTFNLGSMTSAGPGVATLTLIYEAVVIDNPGNVRGVNLNNGVTWTWVGGQLIESAPDVSVVEPTLTLAKDATPRSVPPGGLVTFTVTVNHPAPPSNSPAFDLELTDTVPLGMTYVPGSLTASPGGTIDDTAAPSLRVTWPVLDLNDSVTATFQATMGQLPAGTRIRNDAYLSWSTLPLDFSAPQSIYNVLSTERVYDPPINANVVVAIPALPGTGYAPGRVTELPSAPSSQPYEDLGDLVLEIPSLGVRVPIVGVPSGDEGWDLTWLWNQAGHLEGTAYPGWDGNSALTAHVYRPDGRPGPFVRLDELGWDDPVIVHANGQRYEYRVRQVERVVPGNLSALRHESQPWLTLLTCQGYDEIQDKYLWRLAVRAVLVDVSR
ncbi:MAG: sortase, partial [Anaerolineales bacterium]|nr:sortase [Anaerolineales bacterium]